VSSRQGCGSEKSLVLRIAACMCAVNGICASAETLKKSQDDAR
jgi:hypothetical protein